MKETLSKIYSVLIINLRKVTLSISGYYGFIVDYINLKKKDESKRFKFSIKDLYPCVKDKTVTTEFEPHYTYHPAWAARVLSKTKPKFHIDISSTLHFCSIVSAFVPVKFYDYRPAKLKLSNLDTYKCDLNKLPFKTGSIESISCMHTIEHVGLGRYGDEIDPEGDLKAIRELIRVLALNGNLLIVVPIGRSKLAFNAHRIYSINQIREYFSGLELIEFSLLPDNYQLGLIKNPSDSFCNKQNWGCGCFWFKKT